MNDLKPEDIFTPAEWQQVVRAFATLYLYREKLALIRQATPPTKEQLDEYVGTIDKLVANLKVEFEQRQS